MNVKRIREAKKKTREGREEGEEQKMRELGEVRTRMKINFKRNDGKNHQSFKFKRKERKERY